MTSIFTQKLTPRKQVAEPASSPSQDVKTKLRKRPGVESPRQSGGVSLLELLAVIATISMLAALLVPSGIKILRASEKSQCMANLKALHTGLTRYAADHEGYYPAPMGNVISSGTGSWTLALTTGEYLGTVNIGPNMKSPFLCPAAKRTYANGIVRRAYGMNTLSFITQPVSSLKIPQPSQTLILADGTQSSDIGERDAIFYFRSSTPERIDQRHDGCFQGLFCDGHVELLKTSDPQTLRYIDNILQQ
jgi:prepilin-type processing-associated H-X9-DG protein